MLVHLIFKRSVIKFKIITEEAFTKISSFFSDLKKEMEKDYSGYVIECLHEIKTGDQTYSGPSFEEFEKQYKKNYRADNIRLVIQISNPQQQLNPVLAAVTLVLDRIQESSLSVVGEKNSWVNGVFNRFNELIKDFPTRNVVLHNVLFEMLVQLVAVIVMTIFSIFAANRLSSLMRIEFSEVYVFIITILLLSNLWTYTSRGLIAIRDRLYPIVDIIRVPRKPIFLTIISFVLLATATWSLDYLLNLLFFTNSGK